MAFFILAINDTTGKSTLKLKNSQKCESYFVKSQTVCENDRRRLNTSPGGKFVPQQTNFCKILNFVEPAFAIFQDMTVRLGYFANI